ncbi:YhcN/YlaJ family sporulation lipoprotein [Neobacillus drentensis]|uniref:YhcN/YlaJ family sporulation lipoprotein n=1 Tax=Neobacillus drentensis TaxID=220684 RepID=UPI002FFE2054
MRTKLMICSLLALTGLAGCNNNQNEGAQPRIGVNTGQVNNTGNRITTTQVGKQYDHPYNHNYSGDYSGTKHTSTRNEIRSAQQVASRASEAAEKVPGVHNATSIVQGMDIVVGFDTDNQSNSKALENKVKMAISKNEQGYNVYVTADENIYSRIRTLFTNMNNVKTSNVTTGIGQIIYDIGKANGK